MEALRQPIVLGSLTAYLVLCLAVGVWALRRTRSTHDFFMAGRELGMVVTGVAMFSSTMSGFGFVGGPGLVYTLGLSSIWMLVTVGVSNAVADFSLGKRLRMFAELFECESLPDAVAARYGSRRTAGLTAVAILLGVLGYLATQILAMATVLQTLLSRTEALAGVSMVTCVVVSSSVLVFYCVTGGILASVYTDVVQGTIMALAGLLVFFTALTTFDGGGGSMIDILVADDPESVSPWGTLGMFGCLSWYLLFAVGVSGQPHLLTKGMMIRRLRDYRYLPVVAIGGYFLTALLWIAVGLAMRALVVSGAHPELAAADQAAPEFLHGYAHPLLAGVVFAGIFAAIMSTADSFLNIGAAALVHDLPRACGRAVTGELAWARAATVALAVLAAIFALYSHYWNARLIALVGVFGWSTFAAALVPVVAIGFNWRRATPLAADTAIVAGLVLNLSIELLDIRLPHGVHGGAFSLLVAVLLFIVVSHLAPPPRLAAEVEAVMEL